MRHLRKPAAVLCAAALAISLTSCATTDAPKPKETSAPPTTSTSSTPTEPQQDALTSDELAKVFTQAMFLPLRFEAPTEMFDSIYPGVTAAPDCLTVLGVSEIDETDAVVEFGPSNDRSLTARVNSSAKADAAAYFESVSKATDACIADPGIAFHSTKLPVKITRSEANVQDAEESFTVELTANVMGSSISIIASVALLSNEVLQVAGWDAKTNATNVPLASDLFVKTIKETRASSS